jgi:cell division protein FtsW
MAERSASSAPKRRSGIGFATSTWLVGLVGVLCVIGVVMVGSASSVISMSLYGSPWSILTKDILWVAVGLICFVVASRTDYHRWRRLTPILLIGSMICLVVVLAPGVGAASGGASRWIGVGQARFQPSEVMKLALALFGADVLCTKIEARAGLKQLAAPLLFVTGIAVMLVVAQPDLGTAMVLMVIAVALFFAAGVPAVVMGKGIGAVTILVTMLAFAMPYRRERLLSFVNPGSKASGAGYQVVQSLIGLGSGHLFGLGLGNSREKWGLLPNAHTDFIFSIIGEELGLVGVLVVLVLLGIFASKAIRAAQEAPDRYGNLLGVALVAWISAEAILNIGAVLGVLPVTGIPLPFISFGGSSLVITMIAAGMLVNIARQGGRRPSRQATTDVRGTTSRPRSSAGHPRPVVGRARPVSKR